MPPRQANVRPIVTLTTDFGLTDSYVAEMKGVLLRGAPEARLIDVTHRIGQGDVLAASVTLERVLRAFPPGTIHVAVVDPGVGTDRRILAVEIAAQVVICPDNGLITWPWHRLASGGRVHEITWRPKTLSATFHGRDVMAPVAAQLASGSELAALARPVSDPHLLNVQPAKNLSEAVVLHVDHFGNLMTNVPAEIVQAHPGLTVTVNEKSIGPVRHTYADVAHGELLVLIGSSGLLEIAARNASAARLSNLKPGDSIQLNPEP